MNTTPALSSTDDVPSGPPVLSVEAIALIVIAVILVGTAVTHLGPILKPFLIGIFLYFTTRSAAHLLERFGLPRWIAYLILFVLAVVAILGVSLFVYSQALSFQEKLPVYRHRVSELLRDVPGGEGRSLAQMFEVSSREVFSFVFDTSVGVLEVLIMTFFYLLFIILGAENLPARVRRAFPARAERILEISRRISNSMEQFMRVKTAVSLGMGASSALIMWLFGLDGWLLWGVFFFALNYITYIGSMAACVPPVVLAYLDLPSPIAATALAVLLVVNRTIWIDYIEIRSSGKQLNIDSLLLFLWLAYWGWAWGVLGLILAFPMLTSLKILLEHIDSTRGLALLMSEE